MLALIRRTTSIISSSGEICHMTSQPGKVKTWTFLSTIPTNRHTGIIGTKNVHFTFLKVFKTFRLNVFLSCFVRELMMGEEGRPVKKLKKQVKVKKAERPPPNPIVDVSFGRKSFFSV